MSAFESEIERRQVNYPRVKLSLRDLLIIIPPIIPIILLLIGYVFTEYYPSNLFLTITPSINATNQLLLSMENNGDESANNILLQIQSPFDIVGVMPVNSPFSNITYNKSAETLTLVISKLVSDQIATTSLTLNTTTNDIINQLEVIGVYDDGIVTYQNTNPIFLLKNVIYQPVLLSVLAAIIIIYIVWNMQNRLNDRTLTESAEKALTQIVIRYIGSVRKPHDKIMCILNLIDFYIFCKIEKKYSRKILNQMNAKIEDYFIFIISDTIHLDSGSNMNSLYYELSKIDFSNFQPQTERMIIEKIITILNSQMRR